MEIDVGEDGRPATQSDHLKTYSLPAISKLLGVETGQPPSFHAFNDAADHGRLTATGQAREQQIFQGPVHGRILSAQHGHRHGPEFWLGGCGCLRTRHAMMPKRNRWPPAQPQRVF